MRVRHQRGPLSQDPGEEDNPGWADYDERVYESVIKREIMKGYSASEVGISLLQQQQIVDLLIQR